MTKRLSHIELTRAQAVKAERTLIRLKYAIPDLEDEFNQRIQDSQPIKLAALGMLGPPKAWGPA